MQEIHISSLDVQSCYVPLADTRETAPLQIPCWSFRWYSALRCASRTVDLLNCSGDGGAGLRFVVLTIPVSLVFIRGVWDALAQEGLTSGAAIGAAGTANMFVTPATGSLRLRRVPRTGRSRRITAVSRAIVLKSPRRAGSGRLPWFPWAVPQTSEMESEGNRGKDRNEQSFLLRGSEKRGLRELWPLYSSDRVCD